MFSLHTVTTAGCWWPWNGIIPHWHYCSSPLLSQEEGVTHRIHENTTWTEMAVAAHVYNKRRHGADAWPQTGTVWAILLQNSGTRQWDQGRMDLQVSGFRGSLSVPWDIANATLQWNRPARPQASVCGALGRVLTVMNWAWLVPSWEVRLGIWVLDDSLQQSLSSAALSTTAFGQLWSLHVKLDMKPG